ncbi:MAG: glycosyltransferase family 4 protein [Bacteroidales bacterium]|nr:glycosyltransferase family 4 protein [Bacteroidales bacterium]
MHIKIKYFFRKPSANFHSIEELFSNFQCFLPEESFFENVYMPYHEGVFGRLKNIFFAKKNVGQLNHITGDVNYIALGLPKRNTILTIHDIGSALKVSFFKRILIKSIWFNIPFRRVHKVSVISDFSKNEVVKTFKINENKIVVIPNCVSDKFQPKRKDFNSDYPNILIVGTKENKNIVRSIEALKGIRCSVTIIGKLTKSIENKLHDFKLDYKNYFNLDFEEVVKLYESADLLLFPSTYEGFGVPIIEAQATGTPVITSDLKPMNEVAGDGAMLINPFRVSDIENSIRKMISDDAYRESLIENGLENVKKYRCKEVAKMYYELYVDVLKK